jgi:hypothetical protein
MKADSPAELISVVTLTGKGSVEEQTIVHRINRLAEEEANCDDRIIGTIVRNRIASLNGDLKGRVRRLFKRLLEKEKANG